MNGKTPQLLSTLSKISLFFGTFFAILMYVNYWETLGGGLFELRSDVTSSEYNDFMSDIRDKLVAMSVIASVISLALSALGAFMGTKEHRYSFIERSVFSLIVIVMVIFGEPIFEKFFL